MYFIGNRAVELQNGNAQIGYSSGYTAISFFLPIVVLLAAFYLLAVTSTAGYYFLVTSAFLTGTAVCGMHYVGELGIINYSCSYRVANVVGAGLIAVFASFVALIIFFRSQETWTNSWWKRSLCGFILAGAVSGMHWTATVGTSYQAKGTRHLQSTLMSRTQTVTVCAVLVRVEMSSSWTCIDGSVVFSNMRFAAWNYFPCKPQAAAISKTCPSIGSCERLLR
jgi:NO-binding membrane sensor protein with MHYT domain